jgi:hypothetical protein
MRGRFAITASLLTLAALLAGCGGQRPQRAPAGTPLHAALAWFAAVNAKEAQKAILYFAPQARDQMRLWGRAAGWLTFANVHCKNTSVSGVHAVLRCTFKESACPAACQPDSFWDIYLRHLDPGWRIESYGQG